MGLAATFDHRTYRSAPVPECTDSPPAADELFPRSGPLTTWILRCRSGLQESPTHFCYFCPYLLRNHPLNEYVPGSSDWRRCSSSATRRAGCTTAPVRHSRPQRRRDRLGPLAVSEEQDRPGRLRPRSVHALLGGAVRLKYAVTHERPLRPSRRPSRPLSPRERQRPASLPSARTDPPSPSSCDRADPGAHASRPPPPLRWS